MMLTLAFPIITTERLVLRGPEPGDFDPIAGFYADAPRSTGFGGPLDRTEAWRWFASMIGHWALHGYGFWMADTLDGQTIGMVGIWGPEGWPEPELGWAMFENGEGKSYAFEAAQAIRAHAYGVLGFTTLSSNILPGNHRSVALAKRLGASLERTYENVSHGTEMVYRHPSPAELCL
jgi:RimJ/RimL family protein N-acetyltransferase